MHKLLIAFVAVAAIFGLTAIPADAAFVSGTAQGSNIIVGGDGGSANQADLAGDLVASYTSSAGNDTVFKTNLNANVTATVVSIFGDSVTVSGQTSAVMAPGGIATYTLNVTNYSNQSDTIKVTTDTTSVTGASKDSVTIKVNGTTIWQNGSAAFPAVALGILAPGASTSVTVTMSHDTPGVLGITDAVIRTKANNGAGGDAGGYIGNNGDNYAGFGDDTAFLSVNVKEVKILMAVEQSLQALPASYNGPTGDTIPGSTLMYTIRYDNDGNDTGLGFTINTKIPLNTVLVSGVSTDTTLQTPHTGALATVTVTDDSGVVVGDTDPNARRIKWTFNLGVGANLGDANGTVDASVADVDAGYMQFKVYIK